MADVTAITMNSFLSVYGGEVIKQYNAGSMLKDILKKRVITSGLSATFPTFTRETSKLHNPGDDVFDDGDASKHYASAVVSGTKVITIEKAIIAPQFVDDMDQAKSDFNIHSELAAQAGAALGYTHDAMLIATLAGNAPSANNSTLATGTAYAAVSGSQLADLIEGAAQTMDENFVPQTDRYIMMAPVQWYKLASEPTVVSSDYNTTGDMGKLGVLWYMGFKILNSAIYAGFADVSAANQIVSGGPLYLGGEYAADSNLDLNFNGDKLLATAFHKDSAGTVILKGVKTEANYIPQRLGWLLNASQGIGTGILRTESVCNLITTDT